MEEIWKNIDGYEGLYQVSNLGRVKSLERITSNNHLVKERILKQLTDKNGYKLVNLYKVSGSSTQKVHRLVAQAFIPNPENLPIINHKDENTSNNNISNLEWCTHSYNTNYGTCIERMSETKSTPINQYTLDGQLVKTWKSAMEAHRNGFDGSAIGCCCKHKYRYKSHKGYRWEYAS